MLDLLLLIAAGSYSVWKLANGDRRPLAAGVGMVLLSLAFPAMGLWRLLALGFGIIFLSDRGE